MNPKPKIPTVDDALRYAVRSRAGVRDGILHARAGRLHAPPAGEHFHRFVFGFTVPVTLLRIAWREPETRRSMVRRLLPPVACVALVAVLGTASIVKDLFEARRSPLALTAQVEDDDGARDTARVTRKRDRHAARATKKEDDDEDENPAAAASAAVARANAAVEEANRRVRERATGGEEDDEDDPPPAKPAESERWPMLHAIMAFLKSRITQLIAALGALEWILVWIGREHHDQIAYDIALRTGVPGEPLAGPPRLRLDFAWLRVKAWRAVRFLLFLALGGPFAWALGMIPEVGKALAVVFGGAWAAYWASVFGIANSFLVWERTPSADEAPWFIRILRPFAKVPVLASIVNLYARILMYATRPVWPACMAFERVPWEAAGLAALRGLFSVPIVYLITRPAFGPAATHAWIARVPLEPAPPQDAGEIASSSGSVPSGP